MAIGDCSSSWREMSSWPAMVFTLAEAEVVAISVLDTADACEDRRIGGDEHPGGAVAGTRVVVLGFKDAGRFAESRGAAIEHGLEADVAVGDVHGEDAPRIEMPEVEGEEI